LKVVPGDPTLLLKLVTAHLAGDYLFQSSRLATEERRARLLGLHALAHGALLALVGWTEPASTRLWLVLLGVLVAHTAIDAWTIRMAPRDLRLLALDQSLHLASLLAAAFMAGSAQAVQAAEALRVVTDAARERDVWVLICGGLIAVPAGATVVGRWVQPFREALAHESRERQQGLEQAGKWIGMLERLLVFAAVLGHVESLIGFVIAAKAVLRLPEARETHSRQLAEYYLVGSLASLAWALLTAFAVRALIAT
jgi:hypothetical protein